MISREDLVEQSVTDYVRDALTARGYSEEFVELTESFDAARKDPLDKNYVAMGFNFDDVGESAEMGSDLMRRVYTLQFFVFGTTRSASKNIANVIKFSTQVDRSIPLKDYEDPNKPVIDGMEVLGASADSQIVPKPQPWEEHIWLTTVNVEDVYHAASV